MDSEESKISASVIIPSPTLDHDIPRQPSQKHLDEIINGSRLENRLEEAKLMNPRPGEPDFLPAPLPLLSFASQEDEQGLRDTAPPKTGTGLPMSTNHPEFLDVIPGYEPLAPPQENILQQCLTRETERVAHQENLMNRVVYDCIDPPPQPSQIKVPEGDLPPYYTKVDADDETLIFESRFESGNLRRAIQVYEYEYDLILKPDYNTRGNTQWYYFNVSNTRAGKLYRFNIINMMKPDSLYNNGMKPLMYSHAEAAVHGKGWIRWGHDICYYQNSMKRKNGGYYYTLTYATTFNYDKDTVYFAHCYPYTYTDLRNFLNGLEQESDRRARMRRKGLCQTIAGNICELITVTTFSSDPEAIKNRKGIVITARVHPGESNASHMMKGILLFLTGGSPDAKLLRDNFVFKLVPMLNPDGVINGSYRCGLAGVDLNRAWLDPSKKLHPTIFATKQMVKKFVDDREVVLMADLHGHSRKKNIFMYGWSAKGSRLKEKIFPRLLEKCAEVFSFSDCAFAVQKSKESTARVVVWKEIGLVNSYTLESSFCGADFGKHCDMHFNPQHWLDIGANFCDTILDYWDPDQVKVRGVLEELELLFPRGSDEDSDDNTEESDKSGDESKKTKKKKKKQGKKANTTATRDKSDKKKKSTKD